MLPRTYSPDILELGDRLAALSADRAAQLNRYLAAVHGIEPLISGPAPPPDPDVVVINGIAEPTAWGVVMEGVDPARRVAVIKLLREKLMVSLVQARNLVDSAPQVVRDHLPRAEAEPWQRELEAAGAKASLRPVG
jgi:large subunit ribosomal protein L7/L12